MPAGERQNVVTLQICKNADKPTCVLIKSGKQEAGLPQTKSLQLHMNRILNVGMNVHKENYTLCCYGFDEDKLQ